MGVKQYFAIVVVVILSIYVIKMVTAKISVPVLGQVMEGI